MTARVLLVEDDLFMQRMVSAVLRTEDLDIDTARDGVEALTKALADPPSLVISDVRMPQMDGWTLVKQMRAHRDLAFVPFIFLTSSASFEEMLRGFQLGADDFLPKPFQPEELRARVRSVLRRGRALADESRAEVRGELGGDRPGLRGSLKSVGLSTLLLLLDMEGQSGLIVLTRGPAPAWRVRLFLRGGRIVKATVDEGPRLAGVDVIYFLLGWSEGQFEFNPMPVDMADEIGQPTTTLLREGGGRLKKDAADEDHEVNLH